MPVWLHFERDGRNRGGLWVASWASCGFELGCAPSQAGAERGPARRRCLICGTCAPARRR
jgi:hypothetical protein